MKKMKLLYVNTIHLAMHAKIIFIFVYLGLLIHYYFLITGGGYEPGKHLLFFCVYLQKMN